MLSYILEYQNKKIVKNTPKIKIEYHVFLILYVKKTFEKLVLDRYPNSGTYLSSVVGIVGIIDEEKTFDDINVVKMNDTDKLNSRMWLTINPKALTN